MHKNSQKRYYIKGAIYFTTTITKKRYPYFKEDIFGQILQEEIHVAQQMLHFHLYAYAIMSDHVHILMMPNDGCNYSKIMQFIKRHFTRNVNFVMGYSSHECAIGQSRIRGTSSHIIRKFDEKIKTYQNKFMEKYAHTCPFPKFVWHKSFHDHIIRDERDFNAHMRYIARQNEKHGENGIIWMGW